MRTSVRPAAALADHLVPGGKGDEMGEALHGDGVAVVQMGGDRVVEGQELGHQSGSPYGHFSSSPSTSRTQRMAALPAGMPA